MNGLNNAISGLASSLTSADEVKEVILYGSILYY